MLQNECATHEPSKCQLLVERGFDYEKLGMKVSYDKEVDAAYIAISDEKPTRAIQIADGVHVDLSATNHVVGIELLDASKKVPLRSLFTLEFDPEVAGA